MDPNRAQALRRLLLVADALCLTACGAAALALHASLHQQVAWLRPPAFTSYVVVTYLALPVWLGAIFACGLDRVFERPPRKRDLLWTLVRTQALALAGLAVVLFLTQVLVNRSLVVMYAACSFVALLASRLTVTLWVRHQLATGQGRTRLLVVGGSADDFQALRRDLEEGDEYLDVGAHLADPAGLEAALLDQATDRVVFLPPYDDPGRDLASRDLCASLGIPVSYAVPDDAGGPPPEVQVLGGRPYLAYAWVRRSQGSQSLKHALDTLAAGVGLVALAPLLATIALLILVTMGRPVLFVQERVGLFGRRFRMYKFRTMVPDAEAQRDEVEDLNEVGGPIFKSRRDPRVTRLGAVLRRLSLDELPQLWNVFLGSMSLVGPRPLPAAEQQKILGPHRRRLSMKPGITGLWQVSGRSDLDFEETMRLDLEYVDSWSLAQDLAILARTPWVVLVGKGAR